MASYEDRAHPFCVYQGGLLIQCSQEGMIASTEHCTCAGAQGGSVWAGEVSSLGPPPLLPAGRPVPHPAARHHPCFVAAGVRQVEGITLCIPEDTLCPLLPSGSGEEDTQGAPRWVPAAAPRSRPGHTHGRKRAGPRDSCLLGWRWQASGGGHKALCDSLHSLTDAALQAPLSPQPLTAPSPPQELAYGEQTDHLTPVSVQVGYFPKQHRGWRTAGQVRMGTRAQRDTGRRPGPPTRRSVSDHSEDLAITGRGR